MKNLGLIYIYCAILGRIDALRRAGQTGRADGARMFLDGAFALLNDKGDWSGEFRLECARFWLQGGERAGVDVQALGASGGRNFEIRNPYGDLVFEADDGGAVGDWILANVDRIYREGWPKHAPPYTVYDSRSGDFVSVGYIHRVALGG